MVHCKYDDGIAPIVGQDSGKYLSGQNNNAPVSNLGVNDFVVVKVYSLDSKWRYFTAQMMDGPDEDGDFEAFFFFFFFLKRSMKIKDGFFHPEIF